MHCLHCLGPNAPDRLFQAIMADGAYRFAKDGAGTSRPPSGGVIGTCQGTPRQVDVIGRTMARRGGLALKRSTEITSTGRRPACSWPAVGSRLA